MNRFIKPNMNIKQLIMAVKGNNVKVNQFNNSKLICNE